MGVKARGLLLVGALVSLAAFASDASAQDAPLDLPDSFAGAASAEALGVAAITPALVPVPGLFDLGFVEGRGTYERSNQEGRASIFYPGSGVVTGPSLLCGTFLGPEIPPDGEPLFGPIIRSCLQYQYPLSVTVDPLVPDAATEGGTQLGELSDPISFGAVGARAHAGEDATTTEAEVSDLRILGLPALGSIAPLFDLLSLPAPDTTLASVESMPATTDQRIVDGALVVDANATVTGFRVVGGLVRIGSIISRRSRIEARPGEEPVITTDLEVSGVELAGQPAQITEDGAVVSTNAPTGPLVQQLLSGAVDAVQDTGLRITVLPEEQGESDGIPYAGVGGVVVEFTTPLVGLPPIPGPTGDADLNGAYGMRFQIGTTGVRGFADAFGSSTPVTSRPAVAGAGGAAAAPSTPGSPGGGGAGSSAGPAVAAAPRPATAAPVAEAAPTSFLADLFAERLAFLYLSFTLTAMALCLAPRLSLPARLPASRG